MTALNLYQKINQVHKKVKSVFKGANVSMGTSGSYKAVSHDDVTALLHDPIADAGIVPIPSMDSCEVESYEIIKSYNGKDTVSTGYRVKVWTSVKFVNMDNPIEHETTKCFSYAMDTGDKATGKAYSMAIKYCYLKCFNLESCDEEESRQYENETRYYQKPSQDGIHLATDAQLGAIKKLYPAEFLAKIDKDTLTKKDAGILISNAPKNK